MVVATLSYGNWTTYIGTIKEVSTALSIHIAQPDRTWVFSDSTDVVSVVYGG